MENNNKMKGLFQTLSDWVSPKKETSLTATTATQESLSTSVQLSPGLLVSTSDTLSSTDYTFYTPPTRGMYQINHSDKTFTIDSEYYANAIKVQQEYDKKVKETLASFEPLTQEILKAVPTYNNYLYVHAYNSDVETNKEVVLGRAVDALVKKHLFKNKLEDIINE